MVATLAVVLVTAGCLDGPSYVYGREIERETFRPWSDSVGVHPDNSVLADPENPFGNTAPGDEAKWQIEANAGPVTSFYSWASVLAARPTGESQYYAALNMRKIFDEERADQADLSIVRQLAIDGFQAVLDEFPESLTYDATGTVGYDLATPSYKAVVDLGGSVQGGWILVTTASGQERAIRTTFEEEE